MDEEITRRDKLNALLRAAKYWPKLAVGALALSVLAAVFEGIGLGFILPIVELARGTADPANAEGVLGVFTRVYFELGLPFTLGSLVVGVVVVMTVRYTLSFLGGWVQGAIETYYIHYLQKQAFERAMLARTAYFDREGSDDILNAIVTQAEYAGRSLRRIVKFFEHLVLSGMYFCVALYIEPLLAVGTAATFGLITFVFNHVLETGYSVGDRVADANERIQQNAQAGTQGIRDVKLFGLRKELRSHFDSAVDQFKESRLTFFRNTSAIRNFHQLLTAVSMFVIIYVALTYSKLSLGALGLFLFAMFRLGPRVSRLNQLYYNIDADLPHLVRMQAFSDELRTQREPDTGTRSAPDQVDTVDFRDLTFSYDTEEEIVLDDVSFRVEKGEFVAFAGPSGAGKSTIISLLARLYEPDAGTIAANDAPIDEFDIDEWRSKVAVVRQDPYIFDDTLRANLTIGDREASDAELDAVCETAKVTEFLDELPAGYETELGDSGVRLSGGQRQRVALARALLKDADVLALDEATSDLDTGIESQVQAAIESMDEDYAMITVAHRLSTVRNADRIYTVEDGEIIEAGDHEELIENGETYAELYSTQHSTG